MMRSTLFFIFSFLSLSANAEIVLPQIFSSDMVLQRETEVCFYGWANPGEEFTLYTSWNDSTLVVKAGNDAKWTMLVPTPKAGGPYVIRLNGKDNEIVYNGVLIGEVWLCSGQSNMEWSANSGIDDKEVEISKADYPTMRLFTVQKRTSQNPLEDVVGSWASCSPETMSDFSAVAYFFARRVQQELHIPVGLIDASWGASCAEVWTPEIVFEQHPELVKSHELLQPNPWVTIERSSLYNAMIAPLTKFKVGGVLWYQGESNTANGESYQNLFTNMILSWRNQWQINFPFYYVQIAPYNYGRPFEGGVLRDQQRRTLALEKTGMAMTSDICTIEDIHPRNKQDVGLRLANIALKQHYKAIDVEVNGPLFESVVIQGNRIEVRFSHSEGLESKNKKLDQFEIADENGKWFPAKAKLIKNTVELWSKEVENPKAARYAWGSSSIGTLFNKAGLPVSTFTSAY